MVDNKVGKYLLTVSTGTFYLILFPADFSAGDLAGKFFNHPFTNPSYRPALSYLLLTSVPQLQPYPTASYIQPWTTHAQHGLMQYSRNNVTSQYPGTIMISRCFAISCLQLTTKFRLLIQTWVRQPVKST